MDNNEVQLISQYLKGDEKSLEILIHKYLKLVYNFIYHYVGNITDAEDITQDVFVKVWKNLKKFNTKKNFKTWIFTIAKNASVDFLKKKKNIPFSKFEDEEGYNALEENLEDDKPTMIEILEQKDMNDALSKTIDQLPLKYRTVLTLHYTSQLTFKEIADIFAESIDTIKSRHRRALLALRKQLSNKI